MLKAFGKSWCAAALIGLLGSLFPSFVLADGDPSAPAVTAIFANGATAIGMLKMGAKCFSNRDYTFGRLTPELIGLPFTIRAGGKPTNITINSKAGAVVYVIIESDMGPSAKDQGLPELHELLEKSGWKRISYPAPAKQAKNQKTPDIYKKTFSAAAKTTLPGAGFFGVEVAAANLNVEAAPSRRKAPADSGQNPPADDTSVASANNPDNVSIRPAPDDTPMFGATSRVLAEQSTIKILTVLTASGHELAGQATDFILTVTPGKSSKLVIARFITPIGDEMVGVMDDVLRYIHIKYPNWYADKAELTFADRSRYDGPSIGAAIGTLIRAALEGFTIDPNAAITGDIAANGRIHGIGGLAYKLHGAAAAGCTIVAAPMENYDNLIDAVVYKGMSVVTDIQVIGMTTLDDAVAVMRSDREEKLARAISLFTSVQESLRSDPGALGKVETQSKLKEIVSLAPNHLSARVLLLAAQHKTPRTISATASLYYTNAAINVMLPILKDRANSTHQTQVSSAAVQQQLAALDKLRPLADGKIRPLIDAWSHFLRAVVSLQGGGGSTEAVEAQAQKLDDEIAQITTDPDLNQTLMNEGM